MTGNDISEKLKSIAGVHPSQEWLTACRAHLRETTRQADTADAVLYQVLHSDLRDVVDRNHEDDGTLKRALSTDHTLLPDSFRKMVQVEELLDISLNAEARLSVGPASPTAPTPVGNQRKRCLKLYLSDGYKNTGIHLVAMETCPIPNLSVNSKAGIKLVLRGPLTCRHGMVLISPENATVLGGCVESLVEMQQRALEQAQKLAGVGVDPTVRALIWNPEAGENEEDEGEHESRDVVARVTPPAAAPTMAPPPRSPMPPPPRPAPNQQRAIRPAPRYSPPPPPRGTNPYARSNAPPPSTTSTTSSISSSRPTPVSTAAAAPGLGGGEPEVLDLITPTNNDNSNAASLTGVPVMPAAPPASTTPPPQAASSVASRTTTSQQSQETFQEEEKNMERMEFAELASLIPRLQADPELYRAYESTVFVVPCKMKGNHQYFNIHKKKHYKKKHGDKYEYVMTVHMGGHGDDTTITCRVSNAILQSHFALKPGEMRKLSKQDRAKGQPYVDEGGRKAKAALVQYAPWHLQLLHPQYGGSKENDAILQLIGRDS